MVLGGGEDGGKERMGCVSSVSAGLGEKQQQQQQRRLVRGDMVRLRLVSQ